MKGAYPKSAAAPKGLHLLAGRERASLEVEKSEVLEAKVKKVLERADRLKEQPWSRKVATLLWRKEVFPLWGKPLLPFVEMARTAVV